mmetsp:Transcript_12340/g.30219  ORF Transcript_12340/g.30219 Transcript_12340/m.30219 type:complete len:247 (+) Transcript_12340:1188-1928(+)
MHTANSVSVWGATSWSGCSCANISTAPGRMLGPHSGSRCSEEVWKEAAEASTVSGIPFMRAMCELTHCATSVTSPAAASCCCFSVSASCWCSGEVADVARDMDTEPLPLGTANTAGEGAEELAVERGEGLAGGRVWPAHSTTICRISRHALDAMDSDAACSASALAAGLVPRSCSSILVCISICSAVGAQHTRPASACCSSVSLGAARCTSSSLRLPPASLQGADGTVARWHRDASSSSSVGRSSP